MAKPSRPLSEIPNTPARASQPTCIWPKCKLPRIPGTMICRSHLAKSNKALNDHHAANKISEPTPRMVCVMPKCDKRLSDMPWLHLCNAHLAIVNQEVEKHSLGLLSVAGHETSTQREHREKAAQEAAERRAKAKAARAQVYYVQVGAHIKIGWTEDLQRRMRSYPPNSKLLATHPGSRADEAKMHRRFATERTHGREWYVPSVSLLHHIDLIKKQHGEPEHVTFGAAPVTIPQPRSPQYIGGNNRGNWQRGVSPTGLAG